MLRPHPHSAASASPFVVLLLEVLVPLLPHPHHLIPAMSWSAQARPTRFPARTRTGIGIGVERGTTRPLVVNFERIDGGDTDVPEGGEMDDVTGGDEARVRLTSTSCFSSYDGVRTLTYSPARRIRALSHTSL